MYLACLRELSVKAGCAIHAYCLMTNHVHLLLTPGRVDACSALMRNLGQRYIERNPVRAGMVGAPLSYRWSSHAGNVGAFDDPLLTPHTE